ncbi:MAG: hypothetical protein A2Y10_02860 [Planctomycetes bacterium GWF2_41_51]|nr:MAG: hypothetical protein A2Y10_02860 [Planctomycetes bacterium GWF2_41_51]HBG27491.1 hypothetical protein [Phycisphaerales bacterium]
MANSAIDIPFYVAKDGAPLIGSDAEMNFDSLQTISGVDKIALAPAISEIGGGWYKFSVAFGAAPFDQGDLVGAIDADKNGNNSLAAAERFIPIEVRLDFYGLMRSVYLMTQSKLTGDMEIKNSDGDTILKLAISDNANEIQRSAVSE